jgi:hypothetical protein
VGWLEWLRPKWKKWAEKRWSSIHKWKSPTNHLMSKFLETPKCLMYTNTSNYVLSDGKFCSLKGNISLLSDDFMTR